LNEVPVKRLPDGTDEYLRTHRDRQEQLGSAAAQLLREVQWTTKADFTGAGSTDYLILHRYIVERRPTHVLELGSGITTLILARAMAETGKGHLTSVDHIASYSEETRRLVGPELGKHVTFATSPSVGEVYAGVSALRYREIPNLPYDLIFVDGPSTLIGDVDFPSTDAIHVISANMHPVDIIVDFRIVTLQRYSNWINRPVVFDPILHLGVIPHVNSDDILRKQPSPWDFKSRIQIGDAFRTLDLSDPPLGAL